MEPDEPIEHTLLRNAVAAEVTVTNTEVSPTSTGDRYVRIEGRLGDDEESHAEWAAVGFMYAIGVLSKGWKAKANIPLIERVRDRLAKRPATHLVHVRGHAGIELNERADELAREAVRTGRSRSERVG